MGASATRYVRRGQVMIGVFLLMCIALHPGFVLKRDEAGLSNYGIHTKTVVPYSLAFILGAWFSFIASRLIHPVDRKSRLLLLILRSYACILIVDLVSTYLYKVNNSFNDLHVGANVIAALFETGAAIWMFCSSANRRLNVWWICLEVAGFLLGALTVLNLLHLVFAAEVGMALGFAMLLIDASQGVALQAKR